MQKEDVTMIQTFHRKIIPKVIRRHLDTERSSLDYLSMEYVIVNFTIIWIRADTQRPTADFLFFHIFKSSIVVDCY